MKHKIINQILLLTLMGVFGTVLSAILPIAIPPSILGMIILLILLVAKIIRLEQVKDISHLLLSYMGLLFIPPVVNVVAHLDLLGSQVLLFFVICIISTVLTFLSSLGAAKLVMLIQRKGVHHG